MPRHTLIDLSVNVMPQAIDEALFVAASERAAQRSLQLLSGGLYHQNGTDHQRAILAGWLAETRLDTDPDGLLFCIGAQHAIELAFADLLRCSGSIASEAATFSGAIAAAKHLGLSWHPVEHDDEGILPDDLDRVLSQTGCRIVFTTPVCQNPLGFEVSETRRRAIVEASARHGAYIVEDDIYGIYAAKGRLTYKQLAPERVYYLTSLSKCLSPLVRLGVLIPPQARLEALSTALRAQISGAPPVTIELGCSLIELGAARTAAKSLCTEARARTHLAQSILGLETPPMPNGSPHLWLAMTEREAAQLSTQAQEEGVRVGDPEKFSIGSGTACGVRLSILAPQHRVDVEKALKILRQLMLVCHSRSGGE